MEKEKQAVTNEPNMQKPLRLWPGIVLAVLLWLARFGLVIIMPEAAMTAVMGGFILAFLIIVWWTFFSRASGYERWGSVALLIVALAITFFAIHKSMDLMPFATYIVPILSLSCVI